MNIGIDNFQSAIEENIASILEMFRPGISRFLSVIDGNLGFDMLLSHKLSETFQADYADSVPLESRRDRAIVSGREVVAKRPKKRLRPSFNGFACLGGTSNNIREFEFFDTICAPIGVSVTGANYRRAEQQPAWELTPAQDEARTIIEREIELFYRSRDRITPGLVRQFNLYVGAFYSYLVAFTSAGAIWPRALVIANDHSPVQVALSTVLKGLGIPRIYLQHAEVSEAFPPLDFEHSVLRNERSLETYAAIADVRGATYVIPRSGDLPRNEALGRPLDEPVTVVIYPTARILGDQTRLLVDKLLGNPLVDVVAVKEHPNAFPRLANFVQDDRLRFLEHIPAAPHAAVVGNSSIAVELISQGIPVYQNFDFDPVDRDYYGFVREGLVPEVTFERLASRFWEPYVLDETWRRCFSHWMPTARGDAARNAFLRAMQDLAQDAVAGRRTGIPEAWKGRQKKARPGATLPEPGRPVAGKARAAEAKEKEARAKRQLLKQIEHVAFSLSGARDPLGWLDHNQRSNMFDTLIVIAAIEKLILQRDISISSILRENSLLNQASKIYLWLELKRSERSNLPISVKRLDQLTRLIETKMPGPRSRRAMERALLPALINYGTAEQLIRFLDTGLTQWQEFALSHRVSILSRLGSLPAEKTRTEELRCQMLESADEFQKLRIANTEFFANNPPEGWSHAHAEQIFMTVAPEPVRTQYVLEVLPSLEAVRGRMTLMDVRTDPQQKANFLSRISSALANLESFTCIRLSDGEGYLFPHPDYFSHEDSRNRERHWWGVELSDALRSAIRQDALQAVREADIIGLPSIFRFIRDTSSKSISLTSSVQGRGLLSCLQGVCNHDRSGTSAFSEDKFNVALFGRPDAILDLAAVARKVVVVSSIQPEALPHRLRELPHIDYVSLPTHNNTKYNEAYVSEDLPLPAVYPGLLEKFKWKVEPGTLVLVAGGIIGKIFIGKAKERGAVALDIGHVIDDWVAPKFTTLR